MIQNLAIISGLIVSATCMVLHQAPPVYLPVQYQENPPNYNFAYEVSDAHTGDFKRQQENLREGILLGHYSLLQPDGVTRTVDYRADDRTGFNAVVKNEREQNNAPSERQEEKSNEGAVRQSTARPEVEQPWQFPNEQHATAAPPSITQTSVIHHVLHRWL